MAALYLNIAILCAFVCTVTARQERFDGYSIFEVTVKDVEQAAYIRSLENKLTLEVWSSFQLGRSGEILVPKERMIEFQMLLEAEKIKYRISVKNIQELIDMEAKNLAVAKSKRSRSGPALSYDEIHRISVIDEYLARLANDYPNIVTLASAGKSFEGRDMNYLKISTTNFQDRSKPIVFLQSLIGPCEWITLPASLYAIEKLVLNVTESDLVNDIDWIILPVANPDGYEFTHIESGFRFWRKNRATGYMTGDFCRGVDLTTNFDIFWGTETTDFPCDYFFHGGGPFSEPEARNIRDVLREHSDRLELFIDLQSFGSLVLYGYGNGQLPFNALALHVAGVNMAQAIDRVKWDWKRDYIVGNIYHAQHPTSGVPSDYAQAIGIPMAYTIEMPSFGNIAGSMVGVLVDPDFIEQAGYETWEGIKVGARIARNNFRRRNFV